MWFRWTVYALVLLLALALLWPSSAGSVSADEARQLNGASCVPMIVFSQGCSGTAACPYMNSWWQQGGDGQPVDRDFGWCVPQMMCDQYSFLIRCVGSGGSQ
jgi:hypothetical protein